MDILIQKYLRYNETTLDNINTKKLYDKENIKTSIYEGYCLFKYGNIISEWTPLTKQTRGIILDGKNNWELVNFPFTKFFNQGEGKAAKIDWPSAKFLEKLDGSIMYVWWAKRLSKWMFSSSGTCNAYEAKTAFSKSFGQLFRYAADNLFQYVEDMEFEDNLDKNYCYIFELESMYNQIIVKQTDNEGKITLIGARNLKTLEEVDVYGGDRKLIFKDHRYIPVVYTHSITKRNVREYVNSRSPSKAEGVVVVDKYFNRIKIKSADYVLAHKAQDTVMSSWKNVVEVVLSDSADDIKAQLGTIENKRIEKIEEKLFEFICSYNKMLDDIPANCIENRSMMGIYLKENNLADKYGSLIWNSHFGGNSIIDVLKKIKPARLTDMLLEGDPEYMK